MKKVVVLGSGLVGREVARDLSTHFEVTAVDSSSERLESATGGTTITPHIADLADFETITRVVEPADIVVGALPGWMGRASLEAVIRAGKDTVDIAFFPEDPFELDQLANERGVTAIVDMGVCPGSSSVLIGFHNARMKQLDRVQCLVGGLPVVRNWPFEYKAPFSPVDVIEEYVRPARYVENGRMVTRPALSDPELIHFDGIGTLEALNTDGLRTLVTTIDCPNMKEKTLRYPNHGQLMAALREIGFFDKEPIAVGGVEISPLEFTSALMFPHWSLEEREEEFTVLRVEIEGRLPDGRHEKVTYDLLDRYNGATGVTSMARTTGYTCTAGVHLLAEGLFSRKGICPPEVIGEDPKCTEFVIDHLAARGVSFSKRVETTSRDLLAD